MTDADLMDDRRLSRSPGHSRGFEIFGLVCVKLILLGILYFIFFAHRVPNDAPAVSAHVMGEVVR